MFNRVLPNGLLTKAWFLQISAAALVSTIVLLIALPFYLDSVTNFVYLSCILAGTYLLLLGTIARPDSIVDCISTKLSPFLWGVIALCVRVPYLLVSTPLSTDVFSYFRLSLLMRSGVIPYFGLYFPYGPLAAVLFLPFSYVGDSLTFSYCMRLTMVSVDLMGMGALFSYGMRAFGERTASALALLYVTFPVLVIEGALNGHFDTLLSALIITAALFNQYGSSRGYVAALVGSALVRFHMVFLCLACLLSRQWKWDRRSKLVLSALVILSVTAGMYLFPNQMSSVWHFAASMAYMLGFVTTPYPELFLISFGSLILSAISFAYMSLSFHRSISSVFRTCFLALGIIATAIGLSRAIHAEDVLINRYWWRPPDAEYLLAFLVIVAGVLLIVVSLKRSPDQLSCVGHKSMFAAMGVFFLILSLRTLYAWYTIWFLPFVFIRKPDRCSLAILFLALILACSYYEPDLHPSTGSDDVLLDVDFSPDLWSLNWSVGDPSVSLRTTADNMILSVARTASGPFGAGFSSPLNLSINPSFTMAVAVVKSSSEPYLGKGFDVGVLFECFSDEGTTESILFAALPNQALTNESSRTLRYDFRAGFSGETLVKSVSVVVNATNPAVDFAQYTVSRISLVQRPVGLSYPVVSSAVAAICIILAVVAESITGNRRVSS